jgi:hypothetical protein
MVHSPRVEVREGCYYASIRVSPDWTGAGVQRTSEYGPCSSAAESNGVLVAVLLPDMRPGDRVEVGGVEQPSIETAIDGLEPELVTAQD